jgi:hypothetical protein
MNKLHFLIPILRWLWLVLAISVMGLFLMGVPQQIKFLSGGRLGVNIDRTSEGIVVNFVHPGLPADRAGIRTGDIILDLPDLNGEPGTTQSLQVMNQDGVIRPVIVHYQSPQLPLGITPQAFAWGHILLDTLYLLIHIMVAGVIVWRAGKNTFNLLAAFALLVIPLRLLNEIEQVFRIFLGTGISNPFSAWLGYFFIPIIYALFPNGRWHPRWIWIYPLVSVILGTLFSMGVISPDSIFPGIMLLINFSISAFGITFQIHRYFHASSLSEQFQTKWALFGIVTATVAFHFFELLRYLDVYRLIFPVLSTDVGWAYAFATFINQNYLFLAIVPITLGISIMKYRLMSIDFIIRRTLIYSLLTALLTLVFFLTIIGLQSFFRLITGQNSDLAIILSTLAIVALFTPLRNGLQNFIDRRFFRQKYDAVRAIAAFAKTTRSEVDLDRLSDAFLHAVDETLQPEYVELQLFSKTKN